jgi:hypothetical protein
LFNAAAGHPRENCHRRRFPFSNGRASGGGAQWESGEPSAGPPESQQYVNLVAAKSAAE